MALTGQEHLFKIYSLTNDQVTSQCKDVKSKHKDLTRRHKDLTSQDNYLTSDCLLYTSDAADDMQCVYLGGRRIIKKRLPSA